MGRNAKHYLPSLYPLFLRSRSEQLFPTSNQLGNTSQQTYPRAFSPTPLSALARQSVQQSTGGECALVSGRIKEMLARYQAQAMAQGEAGASLGTGTVVAGQAGHPGSRA